MVFTNAQTTAFFQDAGQMSIPPATVAQLVNEGIQNVEDLEEFGDDEFKQIANNLKSPPAIPDPANPGAMIRPPPFVLGAKSLKRLKIAADAVRYYQAIGRDLTAGNMNYTNTLKSFELQWKSLVGRKDEDKPKVPVITKNLKITRWSESFDDFLHRITGARHAPLAYVTRPVVAVPAAAPALLPRQPHSQEHGSIEGELIARLSHTSPVYRDDNAAVYHHLEEATRGTTFSSTLKPYQRSKDGRAAYLALISQHAGTDKWEKELKERESFMKSRVWKGNSNFSLEKFLEEHRRAYISMQQCSEHIPFQLPDEHTRVRYLMDAIQCNDAELQAALAAVRLDDSLPTSMRNNFEAAATFLLPSDPVAKKRKSSGRGNGEDFGANISSTTSTTSLKPNTGSKTGVQLRYYKKGEYKDLSDEQKLELKEWRSSKDSKDKKRKGSPGKDDDKAITNAKQLRKEIASVMKEESKKLVKEQKQDEDAIKGIRDVLFDLSQPAQGSVASSVATGSRDKALVAAATKLQGILKRGSKPSSAD